MVDLCLFLAWHGWCIYDYADTVSGTQRGNKMEVNQNHIDLHKQVQALATGLYGSFAAAIAEAWFVADATNRQKLQDAFPILFGIVR